MSGSDASVTISVYTNCSLGGMATVLRNRALAEPETRHLLYFSKDSGGRPSFANIPHVDVRVIEKGRLINSVLYGAGLYDVNEISVTSMPKMAEAIAATDLREALVYEFHTSDLPTISREVGELALTFPERVRVPSNFAAGLVRSAMQSAGVDATIEVVPNLVDLSTFQRGRTVAERPLRSASRPLVWVGRLDKGKNPNDFARMLAQLPEEFTGEVVLSLEDGPDRIERYLGIAGDLGVLDRLRFHSNFSQAEMANLYRWAARHGGAFISTSLAESFGYALVESAACGLPTVGYEVGPLGEHDICGGELVPVGSITELVAAVRRVCGSGSDPVHV
ncbi:glycosyltransferase family 4 protein [Isoptericola sp. NPDC055881]